MKFTIPIAPITKKNHSQIIQCKGRPMVIPSKQYLDYSKMCGLFLPRCEPLEHPVNVKALYYMPTRRRVDLCNLHAALHDVLVKWQVLKDDNSKIIVSTDGSRVLYDKENPRTEVEIMEVHE